MSGGIGGAASSQMFGWGLPRRGGMAYKSLVALTIASLLIGAVGVVAPKGRVALAGAPNYFRVAPTGTNAVSPNNTCANPDYGADSYPNGAEGAIEAAIAAAGARQVIQLCPGVFSLTTGEIDVTKDRLEFIGSTGASTGDTVIEGNGLSRLFDASGVSYVYFQDLTLRDGSAGSGNGGAILGQEVVLYKTTVSGNSAAQGGAIYAAGDVAIDLSTFHGNSSLDDGGAVYANAASGRVRVVIVESTFVANAASTGSASGTGGALLASSGDDDAYLELWHTTLVAPPVATGSGTLVAAVSRGGASTATLRTHNSIFSGGTCAVVGATVDPQDIGANFATDPSCPGASATSGDLKLGTLADNGGPTLTVALGRGSVAIDPSNAAVGDLTDQRGRPRNFGAYPDSGAYEDRTIRVAPDSGPGATDPTCTFTTIQAAVIAAVATETIHLCEGVHATTSLDGGVTVGFKRLYFEGDGSTNTIVRGDGTFRLFTLSTTADFSRLTLEHGSGAHGGAVRSSGVVTATDVRLLDNSAPTGVGGAIRADYGAVLTRVQASGNHASSGGVVYFEHGLTIVGGEFTANTADDYGAVANGGGATFVSGGIFRGNRVGASGGALYVAGSVSVTGGDFVENTAGSYDAGAILASGAVTVVGTTFLRNRASWFGGAISSGAAVAAIGAVFEGNAAGDGGAIYATSAEVSGGSFLANRVAYRPGSQAGGGAIRVTGDVAVRGPVLFAANSAEGQGGAILAEGALASTDGTYTDNSAGSAGASQSGGAIRANAVALDGDRFVRNRATDFGGAVFAQSAFVATDAEISGSYAPSPGGAVYASAGPVVVIGGSYDDNTSGSEGGAISTNGEVSVDGALFHRNVAGTSGGAILSNATISSVDGTYEENSAGSSGGALWAIGAIRSDADTFEGNRAGEHGGAILSFASVASTDGTYAENTAGTGGSGAGGAIYAADPVTSDADHFRANAAASSGGAIFSDHGPVASTDGTYEDNTAGTGGSGAGGAIFTYGAASFDGDGFRRNRASGNGGAVCAESGPVSSTDGTWDDNTSGSGSGGAIFTYSAVALGDDFARNLASGAGGAVYAGTGPNVVIGGRYDANVAASGSGGAIYSGLAISLDGATFSGNAAFYNGGAVFVNSGTAASTDGTYEDNSAGTGDGGALYAPGSVSLDGDAFRRNRAENEGGAVLSNSRLTSLDGIFEENTAATYRGGAIWASQRVDSERDTFTRNLAGSQGGAIFSDIGPVEVTDATFTENSAGTEGGAIRLNGSTLVEGSRTTFQGNRAGTSGGAISSQDVTFTASTFAANHADNEGGGIYARYVELTNATFVANVADETIDQGRGGGAIWIFAGTLDVTNVTFKDNTSFTGAGGTVGNYAGATLTAIDSIFQGGSCDATATESGANLRTRSALGCPGTAVTAAALRLGPLQDNGGPTETVALIPGSVAVDPYGAANLTDVDQRGRPRPAGWGDAGAYELTNGTHVTIVGPDEISTGTAATFVVSVSSGDAEVTGGTLSLSDGTTGIGSCDLTAGTHGTCSFTTSDLPPGLRALVATFSGTATYDGDTSTFTVLVTVVPKTRYYVDPLAGSSVVTGGTKGGVGTLATGCAAADFDSIQAALDYAASDGLDHNVVHLCAATYELTGGLVVLTGDNTAGLVIEGDRSTDTIVDGMDTYRILRVDSSLADLDLTIRDLSLTRGRTTGEWGGALVWYQGLGRLTFESARLTHNTAIDMGGGAVQTYLVDVRVIASIATDNAATWGGGAIYTSASVAITDGTFERNTAGDAGGAIYAGGSVVSVSSTYADNSTASSGGAIFAAGAVSVTGGEFRGNRADTYGGAVSAQGAGAITDGTFTENSAGTNAGALAVVGPLTVGRSSFSGNRTAGYGGAILASDALDVAASTFDGNVAEAGGGAIRANVGATVTNATFVGNGADRGGAVDAGSANLSLTFVTFHENTAATAGAIVSAGVLDAGQTILAGGDCAASIGTFVGASFATDASCAADGVTTWTELQLALGPLADNRGPTRTVALDAASVAVEPSGGTCPIAVDQRGIPRPQGALCDAGAFELTGVTRLTLVLLDEPQYYAKVARFRVTVEGGEGEVTSGTLSLSEGTTTRGTCTLAPGMGGSCEFSTGTYLRDFFVGRHQLTARYSGSVDGDLKPSISTGDQHILRNGTQLLYTGQTYFVPAPTNGKYLLEATLGDLSGGSVCGAAGKLVGFYRGLSDGTYESAPFRTARTNGSGVAATTGDLSTGITELMIVFGGDGSCEPAVTTATLLSDVSGGTSSGGGYYTVPGTGRVNFAYQLSIGSYKVRGVDYTTLTGNLVWHSNGKYRIRGTITGYTQVACPAQDYRLSSPACAYLTGNATLSMWLTIDGRSRWVPLGSGIGFQVTVGDGGAAPTNGNGNGKGGGSGSSKGGGKAYLDWFRMNVPAAVVQGETSELIDLKGGNLVIR